MSSDEEFVLVSSYSSSEDEVVIGLSSPEGPSEDEAIHEEGQAQGNNIINENNNNQDINVTNSNNNNNNKTTPIIIFGNIINISNNNNNNNNNNHDNGSNNNNNVSPTFQLNYRETDSSSSDEGFYEREEVEEEEVEDEYMNREEQVNQESYIDLSCRSPSPVETEGGEKRKREDVSDFPPNLMGSLPISVLDRMDPSSLFLFSRSGVENLQQLVDLPLDNLPSPLRKMSRSLLMQFMHKAIELIGGQFGEEWQRKEKKSCNEENFAKMTSEAAVEKKKENIVEVEEDVMREQARTFEPLFQIHAPPPSDSSEPFYWRSIQSILRSDVKPEDVNPESSIDVLEGISIKMVECMYAIHVLTIRQLATCDMDELRDFIDSQMKARQFMSAYREIEAERKRKQEEEVITPVYVAHYLSEAVYHQLRADKLLKSAYVLYKEYNECSPSAKTFHPWKRIFNLYMKDAAKWISGGSSDPNNLTDEDVYSFLVWRSSSSFAQFDCTAGPRAIYFVWKPMPHFKHQDCLIIDQVIAEDIRDPYIADRFARVVYFDLRKICTKYNGKIFRVEMNADKNLNTNNWIPTTLDMARNQLQVSAEELWDKFEPGNRYFEKVPHGCVVTPSGTIPWDCMV